MLLTLQTTDTTLDDSTLDALTLVLLVGFVLSMVALSLLLSRRGKNEDNEAHARPEGEPPIPAIPPPAQQTRPRVNLPIAQSREDHGPAWLTGVELPQPSGRLADVTAVIERLLDDRHRRDLGSGLALFSPSYQKRLANELGLPVDRLGEALAAAAIQGEAPALRSIELVNASSNAVTVRAGYRDGASEIYRLIRLGDTWAIDSIERA